VSLPEATYPTLDSHVQFFDDFITRVQALPGVAAAGAVSFAPVTRTGFGGSFTIYERPAGADEGNAQVRSDYTRIHGNALDPLRAGRFFDIRDGARAPRVALVSETAARRFWPGESPVGKQLRVHVNERVREPREIVGVVGDVRTRGLELAPVPVIYVPHAQYGPESMSVMVRTGSDPAAMLPQLKSVLQTMAPGVALGRARTMEDLVSGNVAEPRFRTLLLAIFAAVSLVLAVVGLYGVVAFSVNQRRPELGCAWRSAPIRRTC
jgi:putative ABC transport system permease protein